MHANLFGDFVKGTKLDIYSPFVKEGIILHRAIDTFIGQHETVRKLSRELSADLPKVASVAIDLYFDHFLAKNWHLYHPTPLAIYLDSFYNYVVDPSDFPNDSFLLMLSRLKSDRWISYYRDIEGIGKACVGVSNRISFPNALMNGEDVLVKHYSNIEAAFHLFMKDAIAAFR